MSILGALSPHVSDNMEEAENLSDKEVSLQQGVVAAEKSAENNEVIVVQKVENLPIEKPKEAPATLFEDAVQAQLPSLLADKNIAQIGTDVAKIVSIESAMQDEDLCENLKKQQAERLKNESKADVIESKSKVHANKKEQEETLYQRYEYAFNMVGINKQLPGFMCIIVLAIYAVVGTVLMVTCGTLFYVVNFIIDGVIGIFSHLSALFGATQGLAKGLAVTAVFVLILGLIALVAYFIIKWTI